MSVVETFQKRNLLLVLFVIFLVAVLLEVRIFYLMVPGSAGLSASAQELHERERVIKAERGKIYDRNGNVLATNTTTYRVFISPSGIKNAQKELGADSKTQYADVISKGLSEILDVPYEHIYKQATEYTKYLDTYVCP